MLLEGPYDFTIIFVVSLGILKYVFFKEKENSSFKWFILSSLFLILNDLFVLLANNPNFISVAINVGNFDYILPIVSLVLLIIGIIKFIVEF